MKLLCNLIFVYLATYQITFLNLLSMEEKDKNKMAQESLSSSLSEQMKFPKKNQAKKKSSFHNKKTDDLENLPKDFKILSIIPDANFNVFDQTQSYAGTLPEETVFLIKSLLNISIIKKKLNPVLVKIVGDSDTGKTILIRTIAQRTSNNNYYSEINLDEKLLDPKQHNSYKSNPEKYIESLIEKFYQPTKNISCASIVAFTKELPLKNNDLKKLRNFLLEIQKSHIAPLLVLHEGEKAHKNDGNYHDKIIYIKKPSPENIIALLSDKFAECSFMYDKIKPETIKVLEGSLPPYIQRIAEEVLRNALIGKKSITNEFIQEILQKQLLVLK